MDLNTLFPKRYSKTLQSGSPMGLAKCGPLNKSHGIPTALNLCLFTWPEIACKKSTMKCKEHSSCIVHLNHLFPHELLTLILITNKNGVYIK